MSTGESEHDVSAAVEDGPEQPEAAERDAKRKLELEVTVGVWDKGVTPDEFAIGKRLQYPPFELFLGG